MNDFFDARGIDTGVEWSVVMPHRHTDGDEARRQHNSHTHVVLLGTYYDADEGRRKPLYFSRNRKVNHIDLLHDVTERTIAEQMERYVGLDWEQRYDELAAVREQERQITADEPHGVMLDDKGASWDVWCGTRRTDEQQTAVGFYRHYSVPTEDNPDALRLEFRPLVAGLPHEQAAFFAQVLAQEMNGDMDKLQELAGLISGMSAAQRVALIEEMGGYERSTRNLSPDFEL